MDLTKEQASYQNRVAAAHNALFHDDPTDVAERLARFMEEANETCQAFGMSREDAHHLVDYTYGRPAGDPSKEIGAAMLTLTSLCVVAGYDLAGCAEADLEKLQRPETIARIRAKRSTRHGRGALPGFDPSPPGKEGGPAGAKPSKYINRANLKAYALISEEDGVVSFKPEGGKTIAYLGRAEFDRRFRPYAALDVTISAETAIAIRDALIANNASEAYHQLYQAVDPAFSRFEPWATSEATIAALQAAIVPRPMAAHDVLAERERQQLIEGWSATHDDQHENRSLLKAAISYAMSAAAAFYSPNVAAPMWWPWELSWWKPKDRRRDLVRAAALIIAEIERLDRVAAKSEIAQGGPNV